MVDGWCFARAVAIFDHCPIMELRQLSPADIEPTIELMVLLNPQCPSTELRERYLHILERHAADYHCIGCWSDGQLIGLSGAWIMTKVWCGKYLEVDHLIVHPSQRLRGAASMMLQHWQGVATAEQCNIVVLDSYTSNFDSHRLYHKHGFEIWGFHFVKSLRDFHH